MNNNTLIPTVYRPDLAKSEEGERSAALGIGVDRSEGPFLVSSNKGPVWVPSVTKGTLLAAVKNEKFDDGLKFHKRLVTKILNLSKRNSVGNVKTLNPKNLRSSLSMLDDNGGFGLDILCNPSFDWPEFLGRGKMESDDPVFKKFHKWSNTLKEDPESEPYLDVFDTPVIASNLIDEDTLVILPRDRTELGFLGKIGREQYFFAVKNIGKYIVFLERK